jgi:hypothetical protein
MKNSNYEVKIYLLYLGCYLYPIVAKGPDGGLTISMGKLFDVKFRYGQATAEKYKKGECIGIGTSIFAFLKNEPVQAIIIKPNPLFIEALQGSGLGNILVRDGLENFTLGLTDIAYKIFAYSISNKPGQKIKENNLIRHLKLEEQLKKQGRKRTRCRILNGFSELMRKGHLEQFAFDEETTIYSFLYSDKYVKKKGVAK